MQPARGIECYRDCLVDGFECAFTGAQEALDNDDGREDGSKDARASKERLRGFRRGCCADRRERAAGCGGQRGKGGVAEALRGWRPATHLWRPTLDLLPTSPGSSGLFRCRDTRTFEDTACRRMQAHANARTHERVGARRLSRTHESRRGVGLNVARRCGRRQACARAVRSSAMAPASAALPPLRSVARFGAGRASCPTQVGARREGARRRKGDEGGARNRTAEGGCDGHGVRELRARSHRLDLLDEAAVIVASTWSCAGAVSGGSRQRATWGSERRPRSPPRSRGLESDGAT